MVKKQENTNSQIVIYKDKNGNIKIDVRFDGDTVWLTQETIATLYAKGRSTITEHIKHIYNEGELNESSTCRNFRQVRVEGGHEVERELPFYNLDMIMVATLRVV